jgi:hypothetical protein
MISYPTKAEGIARGRYLLIKYTRQDFGYDLKAWHDHLATTKQYSPTSRNKAGTYPEGILNALDDPNWIEAVRIAETTALLERIQNEEQQLRQATHHAERQWGGKERECPKCHTTFKSVQDLGQCPQCAFMFFASHPDGDADWWRNAGKDRTNR